VASRLDRRHLPRRARRRWFYVWTDYQRREEEARLQRGKEHVALLASGLSEVAGQSARPSATWLAEQIETCMRFRLQ